MEAVGLLIGIMIMVISFGFFALFYFGMFAFMIFAVMIWIMMLIDVINRKFPNDSDRTTWILVVCLTGWIGASIYYFTIKRPEDLKQKAVQKTQGLKKA